MPGLNKDLHLSTEFLAFLRSSFFAQILFEGAMTRLRSNLLPERYVDSAHKVFDKLDVWTQELAQQLPLFSTQWSTPDSFDAINAMGFVKEMKGDLLWLAPQVDEALAVPNLHQNPTAVSLLAAGILRSASMRHSYVETMIALLSSVNAQELAQQAIAESPEARGYFQNAQTIVDVFANNPSPSVELCERLRFEASLVSSDLRANIHDALILLNVYSKEFTFGLAGFTDGEAQPWKDSQIPPVAAGYWHAYRFAPEDYFRWASIGIRAAPLAAYWRRAGFEPEAAAPWLAEGIPPMYAAQWAQAGFPPDRAASYIRRGIADPAKAPSLAGKGDENS